MDNVYEALDQAKTEIERLKQQYQAKLELAESLKRAHTDQLSKNREASSKLDQLTQELSEKEDEISTARQLHEELKTNLAQKESVIKHLTSVHEKLRIDCGEKLVKCEEENKALALALENANAKNVEQDQQINALKKEVEGVRKLLNVSEKKFSESENKTRILKEFEAREDVLVKLEEEKRKCENQMKWKKEQFSHLEEAHKKLRDEFAMSQKEWEKEKSELLDGISSLQAKLESQIRISEDLQARLEMCNHALAHSESKRKHLEDQLEESKVSFENVCVEYDEARLSFEKLNSQRNQEIAMLRSSLGTKEILYKEMEYQFKKTEQEKQELLASLKELQESQICKAGTSPSSKLQRKLKSLEEAHKGCSVNLKAKETEWRMQIEKLSKELNTCKSELKSKDMSLTELNKELEACDSFILQLELVNEETSLLLLVLKSQLMEAKTKLADSHSCVDLKSTQKIKELAEESEHKKAALHRVQKDLEDEREKVAVLWKKVQMLEELKLSLQKEAERLKQLLQESTTLQLQSEEQVLQMQGDLEKVQDALTRANEELCERFWEANEIEFELREWKSMAEQLEANLKQNHQLRREVEASLIAQMEVELNLKLEKESLCHQLEVKEKRIDDLQQQLIEVNESMKTIESSTAVIARADSEKDHEQEMESLHQIIEEKDERIHDLQQLVASLELESENSGTSFASRLSQMQKEMDILRESWGCIKAAVVMKEVQIQEKNVMITELENDLGNLRQRAEQQEQTLCRSEKRVQETQAKLAEKESEVQELECELEAKIATSEDTIANLHKTCKNLSSGKKNLMNMMNMLSEKMEELTHEDTKLMESLGKIVVAIDGSRPEPRPNNYNDDNTKENTNILSSPLATKTEVSHDERSPLRALNT